MSFAVSYPRLPSKTRFASTISKKVVTQPQLKTLALAISLPHKVLDFIFDS